MTLRLAHLTHAEAAAAIERDAVLLLPVGALEQRHGLARQSEDGGVVPVLEREEPRTHDLFCIGWSDQFLQDFAFLETIATHAHTHPRTRARKYPREPKNTKQESHR